MENLIKKANQDLEATLTKLPMRRTKCDVERILLYNHYESKRVNEFYHESYLQLENNKRVQSER